MAEMTNIWQALWFDASRNAALVSLAVSLQAMAAALLGCHLIARRRALLSDALSHASLPGVGLGFLAMLVFGGATQSGREVFVVVGAFVMMLICLVFINYASRHIKHDAALALALSGFYALGIVLLSYIQTIPSGAKAGLENFILGQSATINLAEVRIIVVATLLVLITYAALHRQWMLLCFDEAFARISGSRVTRHDFLILLLSVITIAIGIRALGLILIVAVFTIPPLTAALLCRRWYDMLLVAGGIGGLAAHVGVSISAGLPAAPSGASVVLVCALFYCLALLWSVLRRRLWRAVS